MIKKHSVDGKVWIELIAPTRNDINEILREYGIDPVVAHELVSPSPKSYVSFGVDFMYCVIHFPVFKHSHKNTGEYRQEVDFLLTKDFLLTATYDSVDSINRFSKQIEVDAILKTKLEDRPEDYLFYIILKNIYSSITDELYYLEDQLFEIEKRIFDGEEREMVIALSIAGRQVLEFKKLLNLHRPVLEMLRDKGPDLFGHTFSSHMKDILTDFFHIRQTIQSYSEVSLELRETNNSLLTTKQNGVVITLTIMAFITFPLSLVASIFGMNTQHTPILGYPYDFWIIIGLMFFVTAAFFIFFKYKKWF